MTALTISMASGTAALLQPRQGSHECGRDDEEDDTYHDHDRIHACSKLSLE